MSVTEEKYIRLTTFIIMAIVISLISCHGENNDIKARAEFLELPPPKIKVLTGSTVDLLWRFRVGPEGQLRFTSWYYVTGAENRRLNGKIIRYVHGEGRKFQVSPALDDNKKNRMKCSFSPEKLVWTMKCSIINANTDDSADYGILLEYEGDEQSILSDTSTLEVFDIMLNLEESDVMVQSWIGKKTKLNCAIHRKVNLKTEYEWSVVTDEKDITHNISKGPNKTSYTFYPQSAIDFGKYKCKISTASTTKEHTILLQQLDYPGAPRELRASFIDSQKEVRLEWIRPLNNGGTKNIDYVVETWVNDTREWMYSGTTAKLSVAVGNLENFDLYQIRVCSQNKVGIGSLSCSKVKVRRNAPLNQPRANSGCRSIIPLRYLWLLPLVLISN